MTRTERLLRLARLRGDLAAVAILRGRITGEVLRAANPTAPKWAKWSESEMRAAWGDR